MLDCVTLAQLVYLLFGELNFFIAGVNSFSVKGQDLLTELKPLLRSHRSIVRQNVQIKFGLQLTDIVSLDEHDQVLKLRLLVTMTWQDNFFNWDPDEYEGVTHIFIPAEDTWQPDVVLYNCVESEYVSQLERLVMKAEYNGRVTFSYPITTDVLCLVDVTYFPFDAQHCGLLIGSWSYDIENINLTLVEDANFTDELRVNSAWQILNFLSYRKEILYECCPLPYSVLHFNITLGREWAVYGFYLILPNFIMDVLCFVQFMLPCESNERVGLGVTLYLALLVYLILIESLLPSTEKFPVFVAYIFSTLISISIAEIITLVILFIHNTGIHDNQREVPPWLRKIVLKYMARVVCMRQLVMTEKMKRELEKYEIPHNAHLPAYVSRGTSFSMPNNRSDSMLNNRSKMDKPAPKRKDTKTLSISETDFQAFPVKTVRIQRHSIEDSRDGAGDQARTIQRRNTSFEMNSFTAEKLGDIDRHVTQLKLSELGKNRHVLLQSILKLGLKQQERALEEDKNKVIRQEWIHVAMVLDRAMFFSFLIGNVSKWIILLSILASHVFKLTEEVDY